MKRLLAMITMVSLAMSVGCSSSLEKEAVKRAREHWKLTQIGGVSYLCEITVPYTPTETIQALKDSVTATKTEIAANEQAYRSLVVAELNYKSLVEAMKKGVDVSKELKEAISDLTGKAKALGIGLDGSAKALTNLTEVQMKNRLEKTRATIADLKRQIAELTTASKTVFELRNIKVEVSPSSLSEADKLNGVEWGGQVRLEAEAFRRYSPQPYSGGKPDKAWSDWVSPAQAAKAGLVTAAKGYVDTLGVGKIKGEWKVVQSLTAGELAGLRPGDVTFKQVEASDLPR